MSQAPETKKVIVCGLGGITETLASGDMTLCPRNGNRLGMCGSPTEPDSEGVTLNGQICTVVVSALKRRGFQGGPVDISIQDNGAGVLLTDKTGDHRLGICQGRVFYDNFPPRGK